MKHTFKNLMIVLLFLIMAMPAAEAQMSMEKTTIFMNQDVSNPEMVTFSDALTDYQLVTNEKTFSNFPENGVNKTYNITELKQVSKLEINPGIYVVDNPVYYDGSNSRQYKQITTIDQYIKATTINNYIALNWQRTGSHDLHRLARDGLLSSM